MEKWCRNLWIIFRASLQCWSFFFDENQVFFKVKKTSRSRLCLQRGLVYQDKCARAHLFYGHYSEDCLEQLAIELLLYNKEVGKARIFNSLQFSAECLLLRLNSQIILIHYYGKFFFSFHFSLQLLIFCIKCVL